MSTATVVPEVIAPAVPETLVQKIEAEVKAVEAKVETFTTAARVDLDAADKLFLREIEVEYLRAQNEITRLSQIVKNAEARFAPSVQGLAKKYKVNPATHVFQNLELAFVVIEKK